MPAVGGCDGARVVAVGDGGARIDFGGDTGHTLLCCHGTCVVAVLNESFRLSLGIADDASHIACAGDVGRVVAVGDAVGSHIHRADDTIDGAGRTGERTGVGAAVDSDTGVDVAHDTG